jgi:23S rRNA pseudouridine955/2504/2580 synthase
VRLDRVLRRLLKDVPLSHVYRMIRTGGIRVNGKRAKTGYRLKEGDELTLPAREGAEARRPDTRGGDTGPNRGSSPRAGHGSDAARAGKPDAAPVGPGRQGSGLDIVFENTQLLVVNKPAGLLIHAGDPRGRGGETAEAGDSATPSTHRRAASLEEQVRAYLATQESSDLGFRPGPLHRLDRNTSGAVAFSKTIHGARAFSAMLKSGGMTKVYLAVLSGSLVEARRWDFPLTRRRKDRRSVHHAAGKPARTWVFPVQAVEVAGGAGGGPGGATSHVLAPGRYSLAVLRIGTGRTHQIRAHAAAAGHPLLGDPKYGGPRAERLFLHAWLLSVDDPEDILGRPRVEAPLPASFTETIRRNFGGEAISRARDIAWGYAASAE